MITVLVTFISMTALRFYQCFEKPKIHWVVFLRLGFWCAVWHVLWKSRNGTIACESLFPLNLCRRCWRFSREITRDLSISGLVCNNWWCSYPNIDVSPWWVWVHRCKFWSWCSFPIRYDPQYPCRSHINTPNIMAYRSIWHERRYLRWIRKAISFYFSSAQWFISLWLYRANPVRMNQLNKSMS